MSRAVLYYISEVGTRTMECYITPTVNAIHHPRPLILCCYTKCNLSPREKKINISRTLRRPSANTTRRSKIPLLKDHLSVLTTSADVSYNDDGVDDDGPTHCLHHRTITRRTGAGRIEMSTSPDHEVLPSRRRQQTGDKSSDGPAARLWNLTD